MNYNHLNYNMPKSEQMVFSYDLNSAAMPLFAIILIIFCITGLPLIITGSSSGKGASSDSYYTNYIKYHDMEPYICYGGLNMSSNYQITPSIYNTSLTYYPAYLRVQTIARSISDSDIILNVDLVYPTLFETLFSCGCTDSDSCVYRKCDKRVGDVMIKYDELKSLDVFKCYIKNGIVIAFENEMSIVNLKYRLTTAGVIIGSIIAFCMCCIFCIYIHNDTNNTSKINTPKKDSHVILILEE